MATFLSYGSDILKDPPVNSFGTGGEDDAGLVKISPTGGDFSNHEIFPADYIIEYEIPDADVDADGDIVTGAGIVGMKVYASYADYVAGTVKYTYAPQNAGESAEIFTGIEKQGDNYFEFSASVLKSTDVGAPTLTNETFVAPGSGLTESTTGTASFDHHTDLDLDGDGSISAAEEGDGVFNIGTSVICYAEGTLISCVDGLRRVEDLKEGDLVQTMDNGLQPVIWNGRTVYNNADLQANYKLLPVSISAKRTKTGNDLRVTRQHRMLDTRGFFVKATDIEQLPRSATRIAKGVRSTAYHHILLPRHEVIFANGLASESFYPGPEALKALGRVGQAKVEKLVPALATKSVEEAYGPLARPVAKLRDLDDEWNPVVMIDLDAIEIPETDEKVAVA